MVFTIINISFLIFIFLLIYILMIQLNREQKEGNINIGHLDQSMIVNRDLDEADEIRFFKYLIDLERRRK